MGETPRNIKLKRIGTIFIARNPISTDVEAQLLLRRIILLQLHICQRLQRLINDVLQTQKSTVTRHALIKRDKKAYEKYSGIDTFISELDTLIPVFNNTIPTSSGHFAGFMRMPQNGDASSVVRFPFGHHPGRLPVPNANFSIAVTACQITEIKI